MESNRQVCCMKCGAMVYEMSLLIHEVRCKGSNNLFTNISQPKETNTIMSPKIPQNRDQELISPLNDLQTQCPKCTATVNLNEVDDHIEACDYGRCGYCKDFFPQFILQEHIRNCDKRQSERLLRTDFDHEMSEADVYDDSDYEHEDESSRDTDSDHLSVYSDASQDSFSYSMNNYISLRLDNRFKINNNEIHMKVTRIITDREGNVQKRDIELEEPVIDYIDPCVNNGRMRTRSFDMEDNSAPRIVGFGRNTSRRNFINNIRTPFFTGRPILLDNKAYSSIVIENGGIRWEGQNLMNHREFVYENRDLLSIGFMRYIMRELYRGRGGMSEQEIESIPLKTFTKQQGINQKLAEKCAVCLNEFEDKEKVRDLQCKHMYHPNCIDTWLKRSSKCPVCKTDVSNRLN